MLSAAPAAPFYAFCAPASFRPCELHPARWLDWEADYPPAAACWPSGLARSTWLEARDLGYRYAAVLDEGGILALAAALTYSPEYAELAAVVTPDPADRRKGYARSVCSFVTAAILSAGRVATVSTAGENIAMQRTALSLGFQPVSAVESLAWREAFAVHFKR